MRSTPWPPGPGADTGPTDLGRQAVRWMERLGTVPDVSHLGGASGSCRKPRGPGHRQRTPTAAHCVTCGGICNDDQLRATPGPGWRGGPEQLSRDLSTQTGSNRLPRAAGAPRRSHGGRAMGVEHVGCGFDFCHFMGPGNELRPGPGGRRTDQESLSLAGAAGDDGAGAGTDRRGEFSSGSGADGQQPGGTGRAMPRAPKGAVTRMAQYRHRQHQGPAGQSRRQWHGADGCLDCGLGQIGDDAEQPLPSGEGGARPGRGSTPMARKTRARADHAHGGEARRPGCSACPRRRPPARTAPPPPPATACRTFPTAAGRRPAVLRSLQHAGHAHHRQQARKRQTYASAQVSAAISKKDMPSTTITFVLLRTQRLVGIGGLEETSSEASPPPPPERCPARWRPGMSSKAMTDRRTRPGPCPGRWRRGR